MENVPKLPPEPIQKQPDNRRLKFIITIEGKQGSGKTTAGALITEALQKYRPVYKEGSVFKVAVFDNGKVPTHEQLKERLTQDGSNVVLIIKPIGTGGY